MIDERDGWDEMNGVNGVIVGNKSVQNRVMNVVGGRFDLTVSFCWSYSSCYDTS